MANLLTGRKKYPLLPDAGQAETEAVLKEIEARIKKEYTQATKEVQAKLDDYLRRFKIKDQKWQEWVASGEKTEQEYKAWRQGQIMMGKRWEEMKMTLARDLHNRNVTARGYITGKMPEVYAINFNWGTYDVETQARVNTGFTLYDENTVKRIIKDQPELLPPPGKRMKKTLRLNPDIAWQKGQIQSVTLQSILQGESIPNMAKRIARTMGERNHKDTVRYARTAITGAENAGRMDAYKRADALGVKQKIMWMAVHDGRTRHEHRLMDDQTVEVGEPFVVPGTGDTIRYPCDPAGPGFMIWNCRCTTRSVPEGLKPMSRLHQTIGTGESYAEWKAGHGKSQDILAQEEKGENIRKSYVREYAGKGRGGS